MVVNVLVIACRFLLPINLLGCTRMQGDIWELACGWQPSEVWICVWQIEVPDCKERHLEQAWAMRTWWFGAEWIHAPSGQRLYILLLFVIILLFFYQGYYWLHVYTVSVCNCVSSMRSKNVYSALPSYREFWCNKHVTFLKPNYIYPIKWFVNRKKLPLIMYCC